MTRRIGIGAQFGGKYFCHDVRVIRLPRHGASLPDRHRRVVQRGPPDPGQDHPGRRVPGTAGGRPGPLPAGRHGLDHPSCGGDEVVRLDLNRPMIDIRRELSRHPVATRLCADRHGGGRARHRPRQAGRAPGRRRCPCPTTSSDHPVYYAGPAKDPGRLRHRLLRPDHRRAYGQLRRAVPGRGRQPGDARQG